MSRIYKYPLNSGITEVAMPMGATILHVHEQAGKPCLWASVVVPSLANEPALELERRTFVIIGTGWDYTPTGLTYIGTVHIDVFVWHVFEATNKE